MALQKDIKSCHKKTIYESFVRCHLLYGLSVWGGAKQSKLTIIEKTLSKIWRKLGPRIMHTNKRLTQFNILKLTDELKIQESKIIWKWEHKKLPKSLLSLIEEKTDRLRGRRFVTIRGSKTGSIHDRLTKRAGQINEISRFTSLDTLSKSLKTVAQDQYNTRCRIRNCYTCLNSR